MAGSDGQPGEFSVLCGYSLRSKAGACYTATAQPVTSATKKMRDFLPAGDRGSQVSSILTLEFAFSPQPLRSATISYWTGAALYAEGR